MSKNYPSIDRLAELQRLIADFAKVKRTNKLIDNDGLENDVEHSYGLAMTCWFLLPHIAPDLSRDKVITYALVHDLVEVHAGDTYFLVDEEMAKDKKQREAKALKELHNQWNHDFPSLIQYLEDYENKVDEESWFVYAVDKMLPPIMINLHEKSAYYSKWKLTKDQLFNKKRETMSKSKHIEKYLDAYLAWLENPDYLYKEH